MFVTLEDETGVANLVVWAKVFEAHRRIVLGADMIGWTAHVTPGSGDQGVDVVATRKDLTVATQAKC